MNKEHKTLAVKIDGATRYVHGYVDGASKCLKYSVKPGVVKPDEICDYVKRFPTYEFSIVDIPSEFL